MKETVELFKGYNVGECWMKLVKTSIDAYNAALYMSQGEDSEYAAAMVDFFNIMTQHYVIGSVMDAETYTQYFKVFVHVCDRCYYDEFIEEDKVSAETVFEQVMKNWNYNKK